MNKKIARLKRAAKTRAIIRTQGSLRLTVNRTPRHIYAQITTADGAAVLASASTLDKELRTELTATGNKTAAALVGRKIAERAKASGIEAVAFDRSGFKYHGRVKALADAAREAGLQF